GELPSPLGAHGRRNRLQRRLGLGAVRPAGLRHIGAAAAALAAERLRALAHEIDGVEAVGQIAGDADDDSSLAILGHADNGNDTRADLLLAVVGEAFEILHLDAFDTARHQFDAGDLAGIAAIHARGCTGPAAHRKLLARIRKVALQLLALFQQRSDAAR